MANEISLLIRLGCINGNFNFPKQGVDMTIDQATPGGGNPGTISVPITGVNLVLTEFTQVGFAFFRNLDDTNFVLFGGSTDPVDLVGKMKPGEPACFRLADKVNDLELEADTATCEVLIQILED